MKSKELLDKNLDQLKSLLDEKSADLVRFGFGTSSKQLKDVTQIRKTKKDIARILTRVNQLKNS